MSDTFFRRLARTLLAAPIAVLLSLVAPALADQNAIQVPTGSPLPGLTLVNDANAAFKSLATIFSGGSAPTTALCNQNASCTTAGYLWHDTNTNTIKVRDQADSTWMVMFGIDETSKVASAAAPVLSANSAQTISGSNHYPNIVLTASVSLSLSQASTLWNGFGFALYAQAGNVTLTPYSADSINGGTAGASLVIPTGYAARLVTNGGAPGNWSVALERMALGNCSVASASTVDLGAQGCPALSITGATTIASFGSTAQAGQVFFVTLAGTPQLAYNATAMILNTGGAGYTASAGDRLIVKALGAGNFEVTILPANGSTPLGASVPLSYIAGGIPTGISGSLSSSQALSVTAFQATDSTGAKLLSSASALGWAVANGNAIGGYQGGTNLPASSTIHFFACSGIGGTGAFASTSLAPTCPTNYNSYYRRLFSLVTNNSGVLLAYTFLEIGGGAVIMYLPAPGVRDIDDTTLTTTQKFYTLTVPQGIKVEVLLRVQNGAQNNAAILLGSGDQPGSAPVTGIGPTAPGSDVYTGTAGSLYSPMKFLTTNSNGQIWAEAASASTDIYGYTDGDIDFRRN